MDAENKPLSSWLCFTDDEGLTGNGITVRSQQQSHVKDPFENDEPGGRNGSWEGGGREGKGRAGKGRGNQKQNSEEEQGISSGVRIRN